MIIAFAEDPCKVHLRNMLSWCEERRDHRFLPVAIEDVHDAGDDRSEGVCVGPTALLMVGAHRRQLFEKFEKPQLVIS